MTSDELSLKEPDNSRSISLKESPMTSDIKSHKKATGSDWINVVYMIIGLFILIAAFQLYFVIQELIRTWISDQFVPVVSAIYYIIVIAVGIWLLRDYIRRQ